MFLFRWDLLFRICTLSSRDQYWGRKNWNNSGLTETKVYKRYSDIFKICQSTNVLSQILAKVEHFTLMLKTTSTATTETILKTTNNSIFLSPKAKQIFMQLKQAFTKALIFHHVDQKYYTQIEINVSGYDMSDIFCQITWKSKQ